MESTINKSYAKTTLVNGDVAITYNYITLANIIIWIAGAFVIGAVAANTHYILLFGFIEFTSGFFTLIGFVGVPAWIAGYWIYIKYQREQLFITPGIGLKFGRNNLPFDQIESIGVFQHEKGGYVYADAQGTRVKVTKMLKVATANAIDFEIRKLSGCRWS